jgi:membrane protein implicated in regulation of membrane protease activity
MDHVLSFILLAAMVSELVLVPRVTTPTLMLLAVLSFVDLIIGLSVRGRRKQPEIMLEDHDRDRF